MSGTIRAGLLLAAAVLGAGVARARLVALEAPSAGPKDLLYLPNGKYLRAASLGQAPVAADLVYFWAIQYYSDYQRADRFRYIEHVFGSVIPELDPRFIDPYWLGALILTTEAADLEGGLRLLDLGAAKNPGEWVLPFLAGWECDHAKEYDRAAAYFDRAARIPGAPAALVRLVAGMRARGGNLREAIAKWNEVLADPRGDDASHAIAERQVRTLTVRADLKDLEAAVVTFRELRGAPPRRLDDLVHSGLLPRVPLDPDGKPYRYDPVTGTVSSDASRVLGS
jgi:tetratricopeptide (TPR) repeat protein